MNCYFTLAQGAAAPQQQTAAKPAAEAKQIVSQQAAPSAGKQQKPQSFSESLGSFVPMIIIFVVFIYLMWRSQSKERKRREEMISSIKAGDKVITVGGIFGTVENVEKDTCKLRIADNVKIDVSINAISGKVVDPAQAAAAAPEKK